VHGLPSPRRDGALNTGPGTTRFTGSVTLLALVATSVVVLDVFTKELVLAVLEPGRFVPLLGDHVGWQLLFNPGAAFGVDLPTVVFPVVTAILLVVVVRSLADGARPAAVVAQALVVGGAIGNVIDRLVRDGDGSVFGGFVVDFVAWGSFPRFNVADASITVGVTLFLLITLLEERAELRSAADGG
jgi:signal peptidase II